MPSVTQFQLNGQARSVTADASRSLLSVLRDDLELTGTKYGCGEGECGACTVLINGQAVRSCLTSLVDCAGKQITTVEGLAQGETLHPVQAAFIEADAMQCGYCTPGMIMSAAALLAKHPQPTRDEILTAMNGNICRCGTYARIVAAIQAAAARQKGGAQ